MTYAGWRRIALGSLGLYAVLAVVMSVNFVEVYPVFSWSLFSSIPNAHETYSMEFLQIGGKTLNSPLAFSEAKSLFDAVDKSPTDFTPLIFELGDAIQAHDEGRIALIRQQLDVIFPRGPYRYRILKAQYDPIQYWETHAYAHSEIIEEFSGLNP